VSDFLVTYLDSINERLRTDVVKRLRGFASALLDGSITPAAVDENWFDLVPPFVASYAPEETEELDAQAAPLRRDELDEDTELTSTDRTYLAAVELLLDAYPEMRTGEQLIGGNALSTASDRSASHGSGSGSSRLCWCGP
jgi:hypothetical protein